MSKTLRVGNLASSMTADKLAEIGAEFGKVSAASIAASPLSGKSRGFGYIEMDSESAAAACISGLNEKEYEGQKLTAVSAPLDPFKKPKRRKKAGNF